MIPRRNKKKMPKMPGDWEMVACTFGVGKDDYLYVVLAYRRHAENLGPYADEFVTWVGNADVAMEPNVGEGRYMARGDKDEGEWIKAAWNDFTERSKRLLNPIPQWFDLEAKDAIRTTA